MRNLKKRAAALILAAGMVFTSTPVGFFAQESAEVVTEKLTEAASEKPAEVQTEKVTEKQTEKVTEKQTEKVTEKQTEKVTEAPTEKQTEKVTEAPTEKQTEKVTEKVTEKPAEKTPEKSTEKTTEKASEKVTEKPAEKETEKVTEKPQEKTTEKQTEKQTEKKAEEPVKKKASETEKESETETEAEPKTKFEYSGNGVTVQATAPEKAKLPQDSQIRAEQIAPGSASYESNLKKLQAAYGEQIDGVTIYDVYFINKDKEKIKPEKGSVKVTLKFANPAERTLEGEIGGAFVAHINGSGSVDKLGGSVNVDEKTGKITSASFTTDSFSPFAAGVIVKPVEEETESETEAVQTESETEAAQTESETEPAQTESETDEKPVGLSERLLAVSSAAAEKFLAGEAGGEKGHTIYIQKVDEDGNPLEGAELQLQFGSTTILWESSENAYELDMTSGEYKIEEVKAPEGFAKTNVVFTLDETGKITTDSANAEVREDGALQIIDKKFKPAAFQFKGKKTLEGGQLSGDDFEFEITDGDGKQLWTGKNDKDGNLPYPEFTYTASGKEYTYTIKETSVDGNGITVDTTEYSVTVKTTDNGDGTLGLETSGDNYEALDFTNKYEATAELQFKGKKTLEGGELAGDDFEFEITDDAGTVLWTGKNDKDGNIPFPKFTYVKNSDQDDTQKEIKYIIKETTKDGNGITVDTTEYKVTVKLTDNGDGTLKVETSGDNYEELNFTNKYEAKGEIRFKGTKTLTNRKLTADESFGFEINEIKGKDTVQTWTAKCDAKGKIAYPVITYEKNAKKDDTGTHTYTISETGAGSKGITQVKPEKDYTVTVTVTDNGDGTLKAETAGDDPEKLDFENKYEAKGYVTLKGFLHIYYPDPVNKEYRKVGKDDIYEFEVVDEDTGKVIAKVKNDETGKINYPVLYFYLDEKRDDTGEHKYEIREVANNGNGITCDPLPYHVVLNIVDNGRGGLAVKVDSEDDPKELDFYNTYEAKGSITLRSKKMLAGGELAAGDFSIDFVHTDGSLIATAPNRKDGTVYLYRFDLTSTDIELGKQYGIELPYVRGIREHLPEGVDADNPYKDGIIYDTTEHSVAIFAEEDGNGNLTLTAVYDDSEEEGYVPTFVNLVTQVKVRKVDSSTQKALKGATLQLLKGKTAVKTWKSDGTDYLLTDLEPGVLYTLHEVAAPSGYTATTDKTFMLDVDGSYVSGKTTAKIAKDGALLIENTPKTTTKKTTGSGGGSTVGKRGPIVNVETGDDTPIALYVGILVAAAAAAAGIIFFRRRRRK